MTGEVKVPKGLAGVVVDETRIAKSDPDGTLIYRGYAIEELAAKASFEETAYLILRGRMPSAKELEIFAGDLAGKMPLPKEVESMMRSLPRGANPIDVLRTSTSFLGSVDRQANLAELELSIAGKMSVLAANSLRVPGTQERAAEPDRALAFPANLLKMITGRVPEAFDVWVFERVLIFYMEHDLNASSFTVRVVASTLADPYAAVTAGLAALKGPLHGGANEAAMRMILEVGDPSRAAAYLDASFKDGKKVIGFGHRVYKRFDPRARLCKEYLAQLVQKRGADDTIYRVCDALERDMWNRKQIPPNLDYYAAPIFYMLGIPIPLFTPIFAASRVFGWLAHYNEQIEENKLIRPDAEYLGPTGLSYVPIHER